VWLAHEIGHDLGMEHQYSNTDDGIWDLMHNMWSASPALLGWHRFLQGWFSDSQILCSELSLFGTNRVLVDISTLGMIDENVKTLMIKLNESEIIVIEARKKAPFDLINLGSNYEGILVYKVNVNKKSNDGAVTLITTQIPSKINGVTVGTLTKDEYVESDGLRITNLGVSKNGYFVEIKKSIPCMLTWIDC